MRRITPSVVAPLLWGWSQFRGEFQPGSLLGDSIPTTSTTVPACMPNDPLLGGPSSGPHIERRAEVGCSSNECPRSVTSAATATPQRFGGWNKNQRDDDEDGRIAPDYYNEGVRMLVHNSITGRYCSRASQSVLSLLEVGFGINEITKELEVTCDDTLNAFAAVLRAGEVKLPQSWGTKLISQLGFILQNPSVENAAVKVKQLMNLRQRVCRQTKRIGVLGVVEELSGEHDGGEADGHQRGIEGELAADDNGPLLQLNDDQMRVVELAMSGKNLYIGGSAGTGKTVLLRALQRRLRKEGLSVASTATTALAAYHIRGTTFHHAFGISIKSEFLHRKHLLSYDVVIIDEISMMSAALFEDFDRILREEAGTPNTPFGGVQVILCGDFLQLAPATRGSSLVVESNIFTSFFVKCRLEKIIRQQAETPFAQMLTEMRSGRCPASISMIKNVPGSELVDDAVNLLPTNELVRVANLKKLATLPGAELQLSPVQGNPVLSGSFTSTILIRIANATQPTLFNEKNFIHDVFHFLNQEVSVRNIHSVSCYKCFADGYAVRIQLPESECDAWKAAVEVRLLKLASEVENLTRGAARTYSIQKCGDGFCPPDSEEALLYYSKKHPVVQRTSYKIGARVLLRANLNHILVNGTVGVVSNFVQCLVENIHPAILSGNAEKIETDMIKYRELHTMEHGLDPLLPVIDVGGQEFCIPPWQFEIGGTAQTHFYALQAWCVPLSLAYAFTVHKVQGLTLMGKVHLELSNMWPCNHLLYVAMSRVRNPEQLSMSSFKKELVVADDNAVLFDHSLPFSRHPAVPQYAYSAVWKRNMMSIKDLESQLMRAGASKFTLRSVQRARQGMILGSGAGSSSTLLLKGSGAPPVPKSTATGERLKYLAQLVESNQLNMSALKEKRFYRSQSEVTVATSRPSARW